MPAGRAVGRIVALLAGYVALTVWLTWPLAADLTGKLPCTVPLVCGFDTVYSAWVVSWVSHALGTQPLHLAAANIYFPASDALYYGPAGLGAVPYALPAFVATGSAAAAINTVLLSSVALTALALHWVVWRWTGSTAAGFVAAWALLMNRWVLWGFIASTPHLAPIQYLPLIAYLAARPLAGWRTALLLVLLITLQCLTDPVYIATAVLAPLGTLALARIARPAWRSAGWRLLGVLAASLVCLLPFVVGYARVRAANPGLPEQSVWINKLAAPFGGVFPTDVTELFWLAPDPTTMAPAIFGTILLGAIAGGVRRWRSSGAGLGRGWCHAGLWALAGTWVSLAPIVSIGSPWHGSRIHLPQYLLVPLGFYQVVRVPARLGVSGMIGLCLLAGVGFAELASGLGAFCERRWMRRGLGAMLTLAVAALAYHIPPARSAALPATYPLQEAPSTDPQLLRALRLGAGPVLELPAFLPLTNRAEPLWNVGPMYRSTLHWRPLLNGYSSYYPVGFDARMRLTLLLPATSALQRLVCETGVRTIVVDLLGCAARAAWLQARARPPKGLRFVAAGPGYLVFDVTIPRPGEPGAPPCDAFTEVGGAAD